MATVPVSPLSSLEEEQTVVRSSLDRLARRIRLALWVRYASYAVLASSALGTAAAFVWRAGWVKWALVPVVAVFYAVALIAATVAAFRSKIPLLTVALLADDRQGLKQRLSSSLALSTDPMVSSSPFFRLQMADAAAIAPALDAKKVFPLRLRWEAVAAIVSVLLAAFATALALRAMGIIPVSGVGPALVAQEGAKLAEDAKRISRDADAQKLPQTKQYAEKLAKLAQQMQSRKMPQSEAMKKLSSLSAQVRQQQQQLAKQSVVNMNGQNDAAGGAASNMSPSQKQAANEPGSLSAILRNMADKIGSSSLSPSEQQRMAQELNSLAGQARSAGLPETARHIDQAAKALSLGQQAKAASELRQAAKMADLEQQQAAQQSESLSQTLRKMADRISAGHLTPAQQHQMTQSLNNLANQAQGTGLPQTAKHINQGSKALAQGNQVQAASEVRQAAKTAEMEQQQAIQQAMKQAQSQSGSQRQGKTGNSAQNQQGASPTGQQAQGQHGQGQHGQGQHGQGQHGQGQQAQSSQAGHPGQNGQSTQGRQPGQTQSAGQPHSGQSANGVQSPQSNEQGGNPGSAGQQANGSDAQGMQSIEQSLQQAEERLSGQSGPTSSNGNGDQASSPKSGSGSGISPRPGSGMSQVGKGGFNSASQRGGNGQAKGGAPSNVTEGEGKGSPTSPGQYTPSRISGTGYTTPKGSTGVWRGKPQQIDNYNPSKNSRYARVYLPTSGQNGPGITRNSTSPPGTSPPGGQVSTVPYYQVYPQFKKSAESALDKEDIPRAYAKKVRQYFQSLTPPSTR